MNLFTRNSPYYHLLKYLLFLLKHPVYSCTGGMRSYFLRLRFALRGELYDLCVLRSFRYDFPLATDVNLEVRDVCLFLTSHYDV